MCGLDRSRCTCHEHTHAWGPGQIWLHGSVPTTESPEGAKNPYAKERTVLTHILGGTTYTCGLVWLVGFAINDHDRFRRFLMLIGVVVLIAAAGFVGWWCIHGGQLRA
jgi:heme A synthase